MEYSSPEVSVHDTDSPDSGYCEGLQIHEHRSDTLPQRPFKRLRFVPEVKVVEVNDGE